MGQDHVSCVDRTGRHGSQAVWPATPGLPAGTRAWSQGSAFGWRLQMARSSRARCRCRSRRRLDGEGSRSTVSTPGRRRSQRPGWATGVRVAPAPDRRHPVSGRSDRQRARALNRLTFVPPDDSRLAGTLGRRRGLVRVGVASTRDKDSGRRATGRAQTPVKPGPFAQAVSNLLLLVRPGGGYCRRRFPPGRLSSSTSGRRASSIPVRAERNEVLNTPARTTRPEPITSSSSRAANEATPGPHRAGSYASHRARPSGVSRTALSNARRPRSGYRQGPAAPPAAPPAKARGRRQGHGAARPRRSALRRGAAR